MPKVQLLQNLLRISHLEAIFERIEMEPTVDDMGKKNFEAGGYTPVRQCCVSDGQCTDYIRSSCSSTWQRNKW